MKGSACCSNCRFTGGSTSSRSLLIFRLGGHLSTRGRSGTFAAGASTLAMCGSLALAHSVHSQRMCSSVSSAFWQYGQQLGGDHASLVRLDCCLETSRQQCAQQRAFLF